MAVGTATGCGGSRDWETSEPPAIITAPARESYGADETQGPTVAPAETPIAGNTDTPMDVQREEMPEPVLPTPTTAAVISSRAPTVRAVSNGYAGVEQWRPLVESIFPAHAVETALRIMACESGGRADATGSAGERGLFQIHGIHHDSTYDPTGNVLAAFRISAGGTNWRPWTCR